MCNAYEIGGKRGAFGGKAKAEVLKILASLEKRLIRRTDKAPILLATGELVEMAWGFQRKGLGVVNNSRADKLESPMWRKAIEESRCLIPVTAFYEWSGEKGRKRTHRFTRAGGGGLWVAGLWEESAEHGPCFSMITTNSNRFMTPIHHRMPAVLEDAEMEPFLCGELREFVPGEELLEVNDAANPLVKKKDPEQGELF